jgi:hypothetical protein
VIPDRGITYTELAEKTNIGDVSELRQILGPLVADRVFVEPQSDRLAHSPTSKLLQEPGVGEFHTWIVKHSLRMVLALTAAFQKYGHGSRSANQTAFNEAFSTSKTMYQYLKDDSELDDGFGRMMTYLSETDAMSPIHLIHSGVNFESIKILVDVGGGMGHVTAMMAEYHSEIEYIVQDRPDVIGRANTTTPSIVPRHLRRRVKFMEYDFFQPQTIKADVILLRCILHNHSDEAVLHIIRNQSIAMTSITNMIWIVDHVVSNAIPSQNAELWTRDDVKHWKMEKMIRAMSYQMRLCYNTHERDRAEWTSLINTADKRLEIKDIFRPAGSILSVIVVGFRTDPETLSSVDNASRAYVQR